ncbi:MAG TPA: EutN/CcmL family microcompartment protein [Patescibacteria group bacterium]|jgi:microcompartment protein CcmK/EutM|nr:EutN/CcmL family microcompartment protein [Patescibacteria group bacterium]
MFLARILGTIVATRKDDRLEGFKLLVVQPLDPSGGDSGSPVVAVDTVSAGYTETVLVVSGSSARMTTRTKDTPVDAAIIGIVDTISMDRK